MNSNENGGWIWTEDIIWHDVQRTPPPKFKYLLVVTTSPSRNTFAFYSAHLNQDGRWLQHNGAFLFEKVLYWAEVPFDLSQFTAKAKK